MKRLTSILGVLMVMMTMMLTSCEDQMISNDLEGTWKGDMFMVRDGYRAVYTEIEFFGDPFSFTSGTGRWLDVYSNRPHDYFASRIDWKVRNGNIHIWLLDDRDSHGNAFELVISDYRLRGDRFWGYVDYEGGSREFNLYRVDNHRWDDYDYGYYYEEYYYYSKGKQPKQHTHEMRKD